MITLPLVKVPTQSLRQRSVDVKNVLNKNFESLIPQMIETMYKADGIGLAAPQIGKNIRLIIVSAKNGPLVCFNPVIVKKSLLCETSEEGCLSVPGTFGNVKRYRSLTVSYTDPHNKKVTIRTHGLLARIFQHEIDHIDGILYIDKAKKVKKLLKNNE